MNPLRSLLASLILSAAAFAVEVDEHPMENR